MLLILLILIAPAQTTRKAMGPSMQQLCRVTLDLFLNPGAGCLEFASYCDCCPTCPPTTRPSPSGSGEGPTSGLFAPRGHRSRAIDYTSSSAVSRRRQCS